MTKTPSPPTIPVSDLGGTRVELPSGGWIQLRDLDTLKSRHRNYVSSKIPMDREMGPLDVVAMQYALSEVMIEAWELPYLPDAPLPSEHPEALEELSVRDENKLHEALEPALGLINPRLVTPDDHKDPDSPTGPAGA